MSDNLFSRSISIILFITTVAGVVASLSQTSAATVSASLLQLGVYCLLTAFALAMSIVVAQGRAFFSMSHAVGMTAFLSSDAATAPAMTVAIFVGGIIGAVCLRLRGMSEPNQRLELISFLIVVVSSVTLPFFIAGQYYLQLDLRLPIQSISGAQAIDQIIPLTIYAIIYVMIYFIVQGVQFLSNSRGEHEQINAALRSARTPIISLLLLPIPFVFLFARVARLEESLFSFVTATVGSLLTFFGVYALSMTQTRLQRQLAEVGSISDATRALRSDLGRDTLLETIAEQVRQLLGAEYLIVALKPTPTSETDYPLVIEGGSPVPPPITLSEFDSTLIRRILRTGDLMLYPNQVAKRAGAYGVMLKDDSVTSWMAVPMIANHVPFGVFVVQSKTARQFDEADLRVLSILASSASIALENARLYHQKSESAEQLATLNQVMQLLTDTLSPNDVLDTVVSSASTIADAHAVSVYLYEKDAPSDEDTTIRLARIAGLSDLFEHDAMLPMMARYDIKSSPQYLYPGAFVVGNIDKSTELDSVTRRLLKQEGKQAVAEIPLVRGNTNIGILVLYFDVPQTFQDEQIDLWQAFATQAAQAIDNARTFTTTDQALEQRVEQLYALSTMGRLLNAQMETTRIFNIVLDYAHDATHAARGAIVIRDDNDMLHVPAHMGYDKNLFRDPAIVQQGLTGRVLQTGQAIRADDVRGETGYLPFDAKTRSSLIVPITKRDQVTGLIVLESDQLAQFTDTDSQYVAQVANQTIIAVDNTRLFQRIREARDNLKVILDAMEEGIILIDSQMRVALANPRVDLIDISPGDILHQPIKSLLENVDLHLARRLGFATRDALLQLLRDVRSGQRPANTGLQNYDMMGDDQSVRYIQRQIIPVNGDDGQVMGLLLVFYNKTEERELARAQEMLSQMIVHDLRSPLTAVTTSLRLLDELIPNDSPYRNIVDKTTQSSRRAIRKVLSRVDSLLDISKMESGEMQLVQENISILQLAKNVQSELSPLAQELDVDIVIAIAPTLPTITVDSDKIERTLLNLVDNALKYSPEQGTVTIGAMVEDAAYLRVVVADEGPGIPDEYKRRLFDRFVQVSGRKTIRRGVGLGLTFCKLTVEAHGGQIWVEDNSGGGSQFMMTLPLAKHPEPID